MDKRIALAGNQQTLSARDIAKAFAVVSIGQRGIVFVNFVPTSENICKLSHHSLIADFSDPCSIIRLIIFPIDL
jgi:hypothetical protein